jgi:hypothetical protein
MVAFGGTVFRQVCTPAALDLARAASAFEKRAPLRSLAGTNAQRQLLPDVLRGARPSGAPSGRSQVPSATAINTVVNESTSRAAGSAEDHDGLEPEGATNADDQTALGGTGGVAGASGRASAQYRALAGQRDQRDTQDQAFTRSGLPGTQLLTAATDAKASRPALRALLALALRHAVEMPARSPHLPGRPSAQLCAVQAYLRVVPGDETPLNLRAVKQLLTDASAGLPARSADVSPAGERRGDLRVLLPLMLLNAERPRTTEQRLLALDRLSLMRASRTLC